MKSFIKQTANNPNAKKIKFSDLDKYNTFVAEVDNNGEIVDEIHMHKKMDKEVKNMFHDVNESVVVIED